MWHKPCSTVKPLLVLQRMRVNHFTDVVKCIPIPKGIKELKLINFIMLFKYGKVLLIEVNNVLCFYTDKQFICVKR